MHIPACDTTASLAVLSFADALDQALRPSPDYDTARWLYVPNVYAEYRYILGTRGEKPLICVGVNPSTPAPSGATRTTLSICGRTARWSPSAWRRTSKPACNAHLCKRTSVGRGLPRRFARISPI